LLFIRNRLDHLATPLNHNLTKYSTRRNSQGLLNFIPESKKVYRRLNKLTSRRILDHLRFESIYDIYLLFNNSSLKMDDLYKPCDFTAINGYPHAIPEKDLDKLPSFQGNNATSAKTRIRAFTNCDNKWCGNVAHEDVKMKLFVLSLEKDALDWFSYFVDNNFKTVKDFIDAFTKKWGKRKNIVTY
jgi:hypothetical protein